jgi:ppGpp synthetase/RelA/SpoT-type nucleotidyltranferase
MVCGQEYDQQYNIMSIWQYASIYNAIETHCVLKASSAYINRIKPSGYCVYHLLYRIKILHSAHTVYLCVSYGSHNKQRLFP